jgi:hypothetical protein
MRRLPLFLMGLLTVWSVMAGLGGITPSHAQVRPCPTCCIDGQSMDGRNACTCRPPLKFLPGNICGSGKKVGTQPVQPGVRPFQGIQCKPGQNTATGCNCTGDLVLYSGGVCNYRTSARTNCQEGMHPNGPQKCVCRPPLKIIENGVCGRLRLNETRPIQKRACLTGELITSDCSCQLPRKSQWWNGRFACR